MNKNPIWLIEKDYGDSIPQLFIERTRGLPRWNYGIGLQYIESLEAGPEDKDYWESWKLLIENAVYSDVDGTRYTLYHDENLWALPEGFDVEKPFTDMNLL
jgi:hypothetical protein